MTPYGVLSVCAEGFFSYFWCVLKSVETDAIGFGCFLIFLGETKGSMVNKSVYKTLYTRLYNYFFDCFLRAENAMGMSFTCKKCTEVAYFTFR